MLASPRYIGIYCIIYFIGYKIDFTYKPPEDDRKIKSKLIVAHNFLCLRS